MECPSDGTLYDQLKPSPLNEPAAAQHFAEILSAVDYLHSLKLFHRDLRPESIFVTPSGCKLSNTHLPYLVANWYDTRNWPVEYLAPEVLTGQPITERLDAWNLGLLLFELMHGRSPFSL